MLRSILVREIGLGAIIYVYSNVWKLQYSFSTIEGRNLNAIDWHSNLFEEASF